MTGPALRAGLGRRRVVAGMGALLGAGGLGGCGFHPLYMPEGGHASVASTELAAIYVPVLLNRDGQLMRQALQQRVEGSGTGIAKKYELLAQPAISAEAIGIQRDTSTTRIRMNGSVSWILRRLDIAHTVVTAGSGRIVDGYNILNQQYFAADLENEATIKRVVSSLADQVVLQLAIYFRRQADNPGSTGPTPAAPPPPPPAVPVFQRDTTVPGALPSDALIR